jgi:hypothetical protein
MRQPNNGNIKAFYPEFVEMDMQGLPFYLSFGLFTSDDLHLSAPVLDYYEKIARAGIIAEEVSTQM